MDKKIKVLKFGGSVLKDETDFENIKKIILNTKNDGYKVVVVVSATKGTTDKLLKICKTIHNQNEGNFLFKAIQEQHFEIIDKLGISENCRADIDELFAKLQHAINVLNDCMNVTGEMQDLILSFGERLSSKIMFFYLKKFCNTEYLCSENIIKTDSNFGCAKVDVKTSYNNVKQNLLNTDSDVLVCSGFIASDEEGRITTLGRNGSDYSASIFAVASNAERLEIWKDIDGLYTADPKIVKNVKFIEQISYQEMIEFASLGNKVVHVSSIAPCISHNVPIVLKNCYNPSCSGTTISKNKHSNYLIDSIIKLDGVVVISLEVNEPADMTEIAIKVQKIVKYFEDIVITISQNLKQKLFSFIVQNTRLDEMMEMLEKKISLDSQNYIQLLKSDSKTMITIVGSGFREMVGISGKIFNVLNKNNIGISCIHDDFSPTRISFLCQITDANDAIRFLHQELVEKV